MEDKKMEAARELSIDELGNVAGGQYDEDATYLDAVVVKSGNLYNVCDIRETVGTIFAGQKLQMHPTFRDLYKGVWLCIVRIDGQDYVAELDNVSVG